MTPGPDELAIEAVAAHGGRPTAGAWLRVVPSEAQQRAGVFTATFTGSIRSPFFGAVFAHEFVAYDIRWPGPTVIELGRWPLEDVAVVPRRRQTTLHLRDLEVDVRSEHGTNGWRLLHCLKETALREAPSAPRVVGPVWSLQNARPAFGVVAGLGLLVRDPSWQAVGLTAAAGALLAMNLYWEDLRRTAKPFLRSRRR